MSSQHLPFAILVGIARAEFSEMPGLRLTRAQAQRLWDLQCPRCAEAVLEELMAMHYVRETSDGMFVRILDS